MTQPDTPTREQIKDSLVRNPMMTMGYGDISLHALAEINELEEKVGDLQDFCIWMTGCGYDFCQHEYFNKQRDKLLK